jgi:hypothetical protein
MNLTVENPVSLTRRRTLSRFGRCLCQLLWLCASAACASAPRGQGSQARVPPAQLRAADALPEDFFYRQRVTARWPKGEQRFDAVLQKRGAELLLVGLSAFGQPGFSARLDAEGRLHVDNRTGQPLPFDLQYVLVDVQRVFYPWLDGPAPSDAERWGVQGDCRVWERYAHGALVGRVFARDTPQGLERVTVRYAAASDADHHVDHADAARVHGVAVPRRVVLDNPLLRYSLTIETLDAQRLTP